MIARVESIVLAMLLEAVERVEKHRQYVRAEDCYQQKQKES